MRILISCREIQSNQGQRAGSDFSKATMDLRKEGGVPLVN